jgi:regulator of protease activity HflC (stomatin/prohibitin superfamily)
VVERFGKFNRIEHPGWFLAIPFIEQLAYVHDMRELSIRIDPQRAITKDNVSCDLGGNVYVRIVDPYLGAYGARQPLYAVVQHAQSALRAGVGTMELDELFHNRDKLNAYLHQSIAKASDKWGIEVLRYEVTDMTPDRAIQKAMDLQAVAERQRREEINLAEGHKRGQILRSEGQKQDAINTSEGERIKRINEAEGNAAKIRLEAEANRDATIAAAQATAEQIRLAALAHAEGEAAKIIRAAQASAQAITAIADALNAKDGKEAMHYNLAKSYFEQFGKIVGGSNTVVLNDNVNDVSGMITKAMTMANVVNKQNQLTGESTSKDS